MSMNDLLSDMLTRIRNGQNANLAQITCPASNLLANVCAVLKKEGYIVDFSKTEPKGGKSDIVIDLKYYEGEAVIKEIKRISKPGRRNYSKINELPQYYNGLGIAILSTPRGVMSDYDARLANVGGEVLCSVF
ncbi:MAG: 30S ribosomal protein S8 [Alphaproteobacteria bacterium]|nr:30S ribosomal protein S8 [Alphaproteobacteria bacterium]